MLRVSYVFIYNVCTYYESPQRFMLTRIYMDIESICRWLAKDRIQGGRKYGH